MTSEKLPSGGPSQGVDFVEPEAENPKFTPSGGTERLPRSTIDGRVIRTRKVRQSIGSGLLKMVEGSDVTMKLPKDEAAPITHLQAVDGSDDSVTNWRQNAALPLGKKMVRFFRRCVGILFVPFRRILKLVERVRCRIKKL